MADEEESREPEREAPPDTPNDVIRGEDGKQEEEQPKADEDDGSLKRQVEQLASDVASLRAMVKALSVPPEHDEPADEVDDDTDDTALDPDVLSGYDPDAMTIDKIFGKE